MENNKNSVFLQNRKYKVFVVSSYALFFMLAGIIVGGIIGLASKQVGEFAGLKKIPPPGFEW